MPEGVEVRKFADILRNSMKGHMITKINILKGRYTKKSFDDSQELEKELPIRVIDVKTKGKFIYMELQNKLQNDYDEDKKEKKIWLCNTLGLTGGWTVCGKTKSDLKDNTHYTQYLKSNLYKGCIFAYPNILEYITNTNESSESSNSEWFARALNHLNVEFILDNGLKVYFYDQLSFGTLKVITGGNGNRDSNELLDKKLKELGPDIMDLETTFAIFKAQITKKSNCKKMIGNVIVNQKIISGIGNYLRADTLWLAKISPFRLVENITDKELELLYNSMRALMWSEYYYDEVYKPAIALEIAMKYVGKYFRDFKIPRDYKRNFFIYRQETDIDGNKVSKKDLFEGSQKRTIYWVEKVQI